MKNPDEEVWTNYEMKNECKWVNVAGLIIPSLFGLFIYLTSGTRTYISDFANSMGLTFIDIKYPEIITNYGCDALWGFALYSGLSLFEDNYNRTVIVSLLIVIVMETTQRFKFVPGTFDSLDIIVETLAIILAMLIIEISRRLLSNEEKI